MCLQFLCQVAEKFFSFGLGSTGQLGHGGTENIPSVSGGKGRREGGRREEGGRGGREGGREGGRGGREGEEIGR